MADSDVYRYLNYSLSLRHKGPQTMELLTQLKKCLWFPQVLNERISPGVTCFHSPPALPYSASINVISKLTDRQRSYEKQYLDQGELNL